MSSDELEFEILGYKFRFRPSEEGEVDPKAVVQEVNEEILRIQRSSKGQEYAVAKIGILVALKIASEKLALEAEYKSNMAKLKSSAVDALHLLEEVSPSLN